MKTIKHEALPGNTINSTCLEAVNLAKKEQCKIEFDFNGITLIASPDTDATVLAQSYSDECSRRHDEYINSPEYKQRQEEAERKERERKAKVDALLADAPENMTLKDPEAWKIACDVNDDGYGGAVMIYAERWARLMEARMSKGEKIKDFADECSHLADSEGITGFMYGCAVSILSKVWKHGEALRLWHNLKTQINDEGEKANEGEGVLNPALLNVSTK